MRFLTCAVIVVVALLSCAAHGQLSVVTDGNVPSAPLLAVNNGAAVDEVVVESSLYIKPKPKTIMRRTRRSVLPLASLQMSSLVEHKRVKRQPQRRPNRNNSPLQQQQQYGQSQAAANAAANGQYKNPQQGEYGQSAANALSQAFNAQGPAGSFGASSAGSVTQAHNTNRLGQQTSAGASHSQSFVLPNGATINFGAANTFANGPGGNNANSRGSAVSVTQG